MKRLRSIAAASAIVAATAGAALAQAPGVSDKEIRLGTIQDMSGPIVQLSKQTIYGIQMALEDANAAGGVNGRQIKLSIEDHGYDPKKSVLAAQKLIEQTGVLGIVGLMGSPTSVAAMPVLEEAKVFSLFPLSAHAAVSEPQPMRWAFAPKYDAMMRMATKEMIKTKGHKVICSLYQDDDFGLEVYRGATQGLKDLNMSLKETTTYKRGATDFSSQVAKLKSAGCELVVLGAILREPALIMAEAKKIGWTVDFVSSSASHTINLPKLGGKDVEGLYIAAIVKTPYADDKDPAMKAWAERFIARFKTDPDVYAAYGYIGAELFIRAAKAAGRDLTTASLGKALEGLKGSIEVFASAYEFGPKKHLGSNMAWIVQIKDGRWVEVTKPAEIVD